MSSFSFYTNAMGISDPLYVAAIWLSVAFACGFATKKIGLPPLVGFLVAGFLINFSGLQDGNLNSVIDAIADIGVMILLFTIGLKLKVKQLLRPEIWATASVHMVLTILAVSGIMVLLAYFGFSIFVGLGMQSSLMLGFALSFSSTVFVVKTLEAKGEFDSYHGKIAIGILIIQDIFAVLFIAFSDRVVPSLWVFAMPAFLWILKKVLDKLLQRMDHGELFSFFGFFATFIAGALSFKLVGLKPDLGALVIGMLLVNHPKAEDLYERMAEYKDFFLIAFFLNVGLVGLPSLSTFGAALILLPLVLLKGILFLFVLLRFPLQPRTAFLGALSLSNFSEFGLIVGIVGLQIGLIPSEWIVVLALLMSFSFILAAPLATNAHVIFDRYKARILRLGKKTESVDCEPTNFGTAEILVLGLGSIGKPTFESLVSLHGKQVLGLDFDAERIDELQAQGHQVLWADGTDSELWEKADLKRIKLIFLTISDFTANLTILTEMKKAKDRSFRVFALSRYQDHAERYRELGVDFVYQYRESLGRDFVTNALESKGN
jgi:glutathione-regulated potassium-efflux system ancillary protein KefC